MKKATFLLLLMFTMTSFSKMMAQEITCDQFCVTNIRMDTNPDILIVNIFFSSDEENHINYPHVSLVTNEQGDTLASGTLNFFVQFPNTEQEYYLDSRIDSVPSDLIGNIEFKYDTNTCLLDYPCLNDPTNEWFPVGAEWYYNQVNFSPPGNSYIHMEVVGAGEINNKAVKIIQGTCFCSQFESENFLHQDGDKVFIYYTELDTFGLLYDFSLQKGDTLNVYAGNEGNTLFLIDSISTYQAGPLELRVQHIQRLEGSHQLGGKIYERMGSDGCLFPVISFCDPGTAGLRCYEDDITGLINFTNPEIPCDYISAVDEPIESRVNIYPNPVVDLLHIESEIQMSAISLIHIPTGVTLLYEKVSQITTYLDTQTFPPGAYVLQISTDEGHVVTKKVIITGRL